MSERNVPNFVRISETVFLNLDNIVGVRTSKDGQRPQVEVVSVSGSGTASKMYFFDEAAEALVIYLSGIAFPAFSFSKEK